MTASRLLIAAAGLGALILIGLVWGINHHLQLRQHEAALLARLAQVEQRARRRADRPLHLPSGNLGSSGGSFGERAARPVGALKALRTQTHVVLLRRLHGYLSGALPQLVRAPLWQALLEKARADIDEMLLATHAQEGATPAELRRLIGPGHERAAEEWGLWLVDLALLRQRERRAADLQGPAGLADAIDGALDVLALVRDLQLWETDALRPAALWCMELLDGAPAAQRRRALQALRALQGAVPPYEHLVQRTLVEEEAERFGALLSTEGLRRLPPGLTPRPPQCHVPPGWMPSERLQGAAFALGTLLLSSPALCRLRLGQLWPRMARVSGAIAAAMELPYSERDQELDSHIPEMDQLLWVFERRARGQSGPNYLQAWADRDGRHRRARVLLDLMQVALSVALYREERGAWPQRVAQVLPPGAGELLNPHTDLPLALLPAVDARGGAALGVALTWAQPPLPRVLRIPPGPVLRMPTGNLLVIVHEPAPSW